VPLLVLLLQEKTYRRTQFYDFVYPALDQITTEAAKYQLESRKASSNGS
jgi:pyruvate/2-oxoglutarate/acetoin dehydrogenase E1 component